MPLEALRLVAVLVAGASVCLAVVNLRARDQRRRDARRRIVLVGFGRTLAPIHERAFLQVLTGLPVPRLGIWGRDSAVFEVVGDGPQITHRLRLPEPGADYYLTQLRAAVPGITLIDITATGSPQAASTASMSGPTDLRALRNARVTEFRLRARDGRLATADQAAVSRTVLASASGLRRGETVVWQWVISGGTPVPHGDRASDSWRNALARLRGITVPVAPAPATDPGVVRAVLRVGAAGRTRGRTRELSARLGRAAASVSAPGTRLVPRSLPRWVVASRLIRGATPLIATPALVSLDELVALVGWPLGGPVIPGLTLGGSPQLPASPLVPRFGRLLGRSTVDGRPVAQPLAGAVEHTLITAPTGSGKSWLAARMILDDIAAGRGCLVFDPKGSLVRTVIDRLPEGAISRTVLVDPLDEARPVPLPLLAREPGGAQQLAVDNLMALLRHRFHDLGPRSSDILGSSLYALAATDGATLFDLFALWSNASFRASVVAKIAGNPAIASFFAAFEALSTAERNFVLAAPMNKLRPLLQRPIVRNILSAPTATFTMTEAMRRRLIVLVSLPEGVLGQDASTLIAQAALSRAWSAVQARSELRKFFSIVVDEAQRLVDTGTDLGDLLARAREYAVGVTLITQSLSQFPPALREIALNSARSKLTLGTSRRDAVQLAAELGPLVEPEMLTSLGRHEAIGQVSLGGTVSEPFTFATDDLQPAIPGRADAVRAASRERFGVPRAEIEASFTRHESPPPPPQKGSIGRQVKK